MNIYVRVQSRILGNLKLPTPMRHVNFDPVHTKIYDWIDLISRQTNIDLKLLGKSEIELVHAVVQYQVRLTIFGYPCE